MTATTIKVADELRDRLKIEAQRYGHTMSEHIRYLLDENARQERFAQLREAMAKNPPDSAYNAEALDWQSDSWA